MSEPANPREAPQMPEGPEPPAGGSSHSGKTVLLRVLAAVAVAAGFYSVDQLLLEDDPVRTQFGSKVKSFEVESDLLDRSLPAKVVVPETAPPRDRSMLVFLHGRDEDERSYLIEPMFEALAELGGRAPVIAFPFGGNSSYWHNRDSGPWASYVLAEVIPQIVARFDVDPDRIAIGGISMGGYGAFNIARLSPSGFCAVGGHSPVLWETASETADGAFDDADDYDRNNVIAIAGSDPSPYADLRLWLDAGDEDPFLAGDEALEDALRAGGGRPVVKRSGGGHDSGYWNDNWDEYLRFYGHALNVCAAEDLAEELTAERPGKGSKSSDPPRSSPAGGAGGAAKPGGSSSPSRPGAARGGG